MTSCTGVICSGLVVSNTTLFFGLGSGSRWFPLIMRNHRSCGSPEPALSSSGTTRRRFPAKQQNWVPSRTLPRWGAADSLPATNTPPLLMQVVPCRPSDSRVPFISFRGRPLWEAARGAGEAVSETHGSVALACARIGAEMRTRRYEPQHSGACLRAQVLS